MREQKRQTAAVGKIASAVMAAKAGALGKINRKAGVNRSTGTPKNHTLHWAGSATDRVSIPLPEARSIEAGKLIKQNSTNNCELGKDL